MIVLGHCTCNGAPIACTVIVQATYTEHRVRGFLQTSRTHVVQRKVSTREKGKSRTVFSMADLLSINPICLHLIIFKYKNVL